MHRFLLLLALSLASVQAWQRQPPFRPARPGVPIEIREGTYFAGYLQPRADSVSRAGSASRTEADTKQRVQWNSLRAHLRTVPEARTDLTASTRWWRAGQVSTLSGVALLCVGVFQEDPSGPVIATSLFGGLGLMALGAGFGVLSDRRMVEAVKKYNATLPASLGLDLEWTPERSYVALRFRF